MEIEWLERISGFNPQPPNQKKKKKKTKKEKWINVNFCNCYVCSEVLIKNLIKTILSLIIFRLVYQYVLFALSFCNTKKVQYHNMDCI